MALWLRYYWRSANEVNDKRRAKIGDNWSVRVTHRRRPLRGIASREEPSQSHSSQLWHSGNHSWLPRATDGNRWQAMTESMRCQLSGQIDSEFETNFWINKYLKSTKIAFNKCWQSIRVENIFAFNVRIINVLHFIRRQTQSIQTIKCSQMWGISEERISWVQRCSSSALQQSLRHCCAHKPSLSTDCGSLVWWSDALMLCSSAALLWRSNPRSRVLCSDALPSHPLEYESVISVLCPHIWLSAHAGRALAREQHQELHRQDGQWTPRRHR